ncbi:activating signal cointegrator 1 complex subunit 2-like [Octopus vulgaris]|uniref:Activating signal cointegrator 1 complex subunit 2-like n=1 Tax=Octopus vulgaris TaxID=6645 RepID=A0AA36BN89_OCTVU|nr:activating signal cointegrator 1 complex subunit 2-like [Octopus vulgaris]
MAQAEVLPLDERIVQIANDEGNSDTIPALDSRWMKDVDFVSYQHPPVDLQDVAAYEEWLERTRFINEDLHWLLTQPHDKFWSQVVFDVSLHKLIDSYLESAPRPYDPIYNQLTLDARELQNEVHRRIFLTCVRMATHKESKENFLTPSIFGEIIYKNFIFDIPKLMDLCALYGQGNRQLLSKMVGNIFKQQPKYENDLREVISTVCEVFNGMLTQCGLDESLAPTKLTDQNPQKLNNISSLEFQDIIFYLVDVSYTLSSFIEIYPPARIYFHEANFCLRLATFYDLIVPSLTSALKTKEFEMPSTKLLLKNRLSLAKKQMLSIFYEILNYCCIQPILDKSSTDEKQQLETYIENYLQILALVISERRFIADYEGQYSIQNEISILRQTSAMIDETRLSFLQNAFDSSFSLFGKRNQPKGSKNAGGRCTPEGCVGNSEERLQAIDGKEKSTDNGSKFAQPENLVGACANPELESLICSVKELFPDLHDSFVHACLEEMDFNAEMVINSLLEDNLPPSLDQLDRFQPKEPSPPAPSSPPAPPSSPVHSVLDSRRNIFDYDEFDVFHRDTVDRTKIHKGKQDIAKQVDLNDKTDIRELKATYELYGNVDAATLYDKHLLEANLYEDEYDDTYDDNDAGLSVGDTHTDDLLALRPFTVPRALVNINQAKRNDIAGHNQPDNDSSSSDQDEPSFKKADNFIEDPAKLREQREQRIRSQRGGNRGWSAKEPATTDEKPVYDVKGRSKGQGQNHEVLHNRQWKEKHKGSRANHNRRALADRKRSKGFGLLGPMK